MPAALAAAALLAVAGVEPKRGNVTHKLSRAEIIWDNWGVPHIYAQDQAAAHYAFGWASARDHGEIILRLIGGAQCRGAEYWGKGDLRLIVDKFLITLGARDVGNMFYDMTTQFSRDVMDSFAAGLNDYVHAHRERFSEVGALRVIDIGGNITGRDIALHSHLDLMLFASITSMPTRLIPFLNSPDDPEDPTLPVKQYMRERVQSEGFKRYAAAVEKGEYYTPAGPIGSNGMAATRAGGGGLLHTNPHLVWVADGEAIGGVGGGSAMTFYEHQIVIESEGIDFYGASLIGMPVPAMGFSKYGGWTNTVNTVNAYSLFSIPVRFALFKPCGAQYQLDGEWKDFTATEYKVGVYGGSTETHTVCESEWGPVILMDRLITGRATVYRWGGKVFGEQCKEKKRKYSLLTIDQTWDMMQAKNVADFKTAMKMQQLPMFTYIYADHAGDLFYLSNGWVPDYGSGSYAKWSGPPVEANTSEFLWQQVVPFERQPQVTSPASGFITNANDPPWQATMPLFTPNPADSPEWFSPPLNLPSNSGFGWRPKACMRATACAPCTFDQYVNGSMSVEIESARHFLAPLLGMAKTSTDKRVLRALAVLEAWDGRSGPESEGTLLWLRFRTEFLGGYQGEVPWDAADPYNTPRGIPAIDRDAAMDALARVVDGMTKDGLQLHEPWGAYKLLPKDNHGEKWGVSGTTDDSVRNAHASNDGPGPHTAWAGGTFKAVTEFLPGAETYGRARVQTSYGSQSMPAAPHNGDQWEMFSKQQYREGLLTRAAVQKHAEATQNLVYSH
eukprot:TRINITY_DN32189_c0_g1_i1.p1 TRINITY_DN32189_c0_g1~~TRINITY_DN32189_c0_g1_i1.p1  ORF type:complete len:785 (+),score=252.83 TRINITY_DN32189_c0_g1_i1:70-2424(+)